jgi:hypothetical protein
MRPRVELALTVVALLVAALIPVFTCRRLMERDLATAAASDGGARD